MRKTMFALSFSVLSLAWSTPAAETEWQHVPLRTAAQKANGHSGGEMGQMVYTITISPSNPQCMALGIDTAQVYISTNGGKLWGMRNHGLRANGVQSVAFDPLNENVLFAFGLNSRAGTPQDGREITPAFLKKFTSARVGGVCRSEDQGLTWKRVCEAVALRTQAQNQYFAFDPESFDGTRCRVIYASSHNRGLLKSLDGGENWTALGFERKRIHAVLLHPTNNHLLFVAGNHGLHRSDDAGTTFVRIGRGLPEKALVYGLALNAKSVNIVYVALGKDGVWWSQDGGRTFTPRGEGLYKRDWRRLAISPVDPDVLYVGAQCTGGTGRVGCSRDGGASWQPMGEWEPQFLGGTPYFAEGVAAHPTEANTAFTGGRVHKTTDAGLTWRHSSNGISGCRFQNVSFRPDDPNTFMVFYTDHGAAITHDGGDTFSWVNSLRKFHPMSCGEGAWDPAPDSKRILTSVGGWTQRQLILSLDAGATWEVVRTEKAGYPCPTFHPQDPNVLYVGAGENGLRSDDGGHTWDPIAHSPRTICRGDGDILFASRSLGRKEGGLPEYEILKSTDRGVTWHALPGKITGTLRAMACDPRDGSRVYCAASYTGIWVFADNTWSLRTDEHGLTKDQFGAMLYAELAVDATRPNIIHAGQMHCWAGRSGGVSRSTDFGMTWEDITGNLGPWLTVWGLSVSPHDGTVYVGTDYGTWRLPRP
ncbi:MAG: hypothetical protein HN742_08110 [Lentisphaerae bacterium]|jgi:photosystem II stability/assembly factor-like uncharacterized protein|nr:hypothetical protein [Lentisphaerota bacterium]MBT4816309.1 hypothetical protein [Lentisphaerota bacterium]MBT5613066.1 hypothetical protein [Lentisphaerota bacterium]MBT7059325.1 hypothetical protein [Lentisphaerota bacterium]MBT7841821.1 hypothetical protein [Lentisphaerota bacterium]